MAIEHNYVENEIKSFVYQIFGFFDKHVDVEKILTCLVDRNLVMDFPDWEIRSAHDFRDWYANVERNCEWNLHKIETIDVKSRESGGYDVDVVLRWQALYRGEKRIGATLAVQRWFLVESETGLKIASYKVTLTPLPTPQFFEGGKPTDAFSRAQESASGRKIPLDSRPVAEAFNRVHARFGSHTRLGQYDLNEAVARNDLIAVEHL